MSTHIAVAGALFSAFLFSIPLRAGLVFEPNHGQTDSSVRFLARTSEGVVFVADREIVLHRGSAKSEETVRIQFVSDGQGEGGKWESLEPTGHKTSYFVGRDPQAWVRDLQHYRKVVRHGIAAGVDLVLYGNQKDQLEYDLVLAPGVDTKSVRLRIRAGKGERTSIAASGDLLIGKMVRQRKPLVYQTTSGEQRQLVEGRFRRLPGGDFAFEIGKYDRTRALVIDPVIESSVYLGGRGNDAITALGGDDEVIGTTTSVDFPGAPIKKRNGTDVFYRTATSTMIIGGSGDDSTASAQPPDDVNGRLSMVAGTTNSRDLPTTAGSMPIEADLQYNYSGGATDGFVLIILEYGRFALFYYGTSGDDQITAFGRRGLTWYITGFTNGAELPWQKPSTTGYRGGFDAFLAAGDAASGLFRPNFSTYIGGTGDDRSYGALGRGSDIYVVGETSSPDFPLIQAYQSQRRGPSDSFVARIRYDLSATNPSPTIENSTLLGGSGWDRANVLISNSAGTEFYVAGATSSIDFPARLASQGSFGGGASDAFIARFDANLATLGLSTYLGGTGADEAFALSQDSFRNLYAGGRTSSANFPVRNAVQTQFGGGPWDGFLQQMDAAGTVVHATYFGGTGDDSVVALRNPDRGVWFVAGSTTSANLPGAILPSTESSVRAGTQEGFLARILDGDLSTPARVVVPRYARAYPGLRAGDLTKVGSGVAASVESSDPSQVVVSLNYLNPGAARDESIWNSSLGSYAVDCLSDSGEADVTIRIAGFATTRSHVVCVPPILITSSSRVSLPLWGGPLVRYVSLTGVDPATGERLGLFSLRPDLATFPGVTITSAAPSIAVPVDPSTMMTTSTIDRYGTFAVKPVANGQTRFTIGGPGFTPAVLDVAIEPPQTTVVAVSPGFQRRVFFSTGRLPFGTGIRLRSLDPSKVLLSSYLEAPNASAVLETGSGIDFFIRAIRGSARAGDIVGIELTVNDSPSRLFDVQIVDPVLSLSPQTKTLSAGSTSYINVIFKAGSSAQYLQPSEPNVGLAVASSAGGLVSFTPQNITKFVSEFVLTTLAPGETVLTPQIVSNAIPVSGVESLPLTITPAPPIRGIQDQYLGKNLTAHQNLTLPAFALKQVATITSSRPDLVSLRESGFAAISSSPNQLQFRVSGFSLGYALNGLDSQGSSVITISVPGMQPLSYNVRLRPTGLFWSQVEISTPGILVEVPVHAGPIDPVDGMPLDTQTFLGGSAPTYDSINSNPSVAIASNLLLTAIRPRAVGETFLTIQQPPGFATPNLRQTLKVAVSAPPAEPVPATFPVHVLIDTGGGTVTGSVPCSTWGSYCTQAVATGSTITLRAVGSATASFKEWAGNCVGTGVDCVVTVNGPLTIRARFTAITPPPPPVTGLRFIPLAPCRVVDTRESQKQGPVVEGLTERTFNILAGNTACPSTSYTAKAYSLNITVVPRGTLGYLTVWPAGQSRPVVSTLNALDGRVKANAAIVSAGEPNGQVKVFATNSTDVIIDINGIFVSGSEAAAQQFYPVTPCRIADTRLAAGPLGGPSLIAAATRSFPVLSSSCGIPASATAFALNVTAVTNQLLGYISIWPDNGSPQPVVSTLNNLTGTIVANATIVPAGTGGRVNVFASNPTDLLLDITGYFAPAGSSGGLNFNATAPCRLLDTRNAEGVLGGPMQAGVSTRNYPLLSSACSIPSTARAYALNATVLPSPTLGYMTVWPFGIAQPVVSTLNAIDGSLTSNALIVPSGTGGQVSVFVTNYTHLLLDLSGYFAP